MFLTSARHHHKLFSWHCHLIDRLIILPGTSQRMADALSDLFREESAAYVALNEYLQQRKNTK